MELEIDDICSIPNIFNLILLEEDIDKNKIKKIIVKIDNYGSVKLFNKDGEEHIWSLKRKLILNEILDSIVIDSNVSVKVCRNGEIVSYFVNAEVNESKGVAPIFPAYKKLDWEICLGCCFTPLSIPLITVDNDMSNITDLSIKTINTLECFLNYNNRKKIGYV